MRVATTLLALALLAPLGAHALMGELDVDDRADTPGPIKLPAGVQVLRDRAYGVDARQKYDVYLPPSGTARKGGAPVIFMVHGGAWRLGDKASRKVVERKVAHWVTRGWVLVSANYRMLPNARANLQAEDVAHALAEAQAHAGEWGADRRQFVLMGHSAGAHLVGLLASDAPTPYSARLTPWRAAVLLDSAVYDVPQLMQLPHFRFYDDVFGRDPKFWQANSPYHALTHAVAPILAVCSTRRVVSCSTADRYVAKAREVGGQARVLRTELSHGDINGNLGDDSSYTRQVDEFIDGVMAGK